MDDSSTRSVVGKALLFSAVVTAALGAAALGGAFPVDPAVRPILAVCLFVVAAGESLIALYFLTRS